jgi:hypothetical protein
MEKYARCLDFEATIIQDIPKRAGVKKEKVVIRMDKNPEIPDSAMSFKEIGAFLDEYDPNAVQLPGSPKPNAADKEKRLWDRMHCHAENFLKKSEAEYERLVKQLENDFKDSGES